MAVYKQCITDQSTIRVSAGYPHYPDGSVHGGIDTVHTNHQSYAPMAGTVETAHTWQGGTTGNDSWGNYIVVKMSDNSYWLAAHFVSQIHSVGEQLLVVNILESKDKQVMLVVFIRTGNTG